MLSCISFKIKNMEVEPRRFLRTRVLQFHKQKKQGNETSDFGLRKEDFGLANPNLDLTARKPRLTSV